MTANRNLPNTSFNYIVATRNGSGNSTNVTVSMNNYSTMPYILSNESSFSGIAAVTLEQIFCPISSESGGIFPHLESPDYSVDRFNYGIIPTTGLDKPEPHETIISRSSSKQKRSIGLALPIYAAGRGLDIYGDVVGGDDEFDILNFKAGPIDLRWDDSRKVWIGGQSIVRGYLISDITKADGRNKPSEFTIMTYKQIGSAKTSILSIGDNDGSVEITISSSNGAVQDITVGETILITNSSVTAYNTYHTITEVVSQTKFVTDISYVSSTTNNGEYSFHGTKYIRNKSVAVKNYDPYFSIELATKCTVSSDQSSCSYTDADIFVVAASIGGEYVPVYIGCPHE